MGKIKKIIEFTIFVILIFLLYRHFIYSEPIIFEDGSDFIIDLQKNPIQSLYIGSKKITIDSPDGSFYLHPRASYKIGGKVVGLANYSSGTEANISPIDLCLIWGDITEPDANDYIKYEEGYRYCKFTISENNKEYSVEYTQVHMSNNHIIPANDNIKDALEKIKESDIVYLEGYLVDVRATLKEKQQWVWNTSLIRNDHGCEIIYVKKIVLNKKLIQ